MKILCSILLFVIIESVLSSQSGPKTKIKKTIPHIDALIEELEAQPWPGDEAACLQQILSVLHNVNNFTLWATWIWDSIQPPVGALFASRYQLGNYDECMNAPWITSHPELRTQYCLADVVLTDSTPRRHSDMFDPYGSTELYMKTTTKHGLDFRTLTWGVCVPATCAPRSVTRFLRALLRNSHLARVPAPSVALLSCQVAGEPHRYSTGFYVFIIVSVMLFLIALISTWYVKIKKITNSESIMMDIANSFNINRNVYDLVKTSKGDNIEVLNGIRFLGACSIVSFHVFVFQLLHGVNNGLETEKTLDTWLGTMLLHLMLLVETFFLMSGILLVKSYKTKNTNPLTMLVKRYFRIMFPLMVMVYFMRSVYVHTGSGPLWPTFANQQQAFCQDHWWRNLLLINNYISKFEICHIQSWSVSCEYQLAIISTCLLYLWRRDQSTVGPTYALLAASALLIPGIITYRNNYTAILAANFSLMKTEDSFSHLFYIYLPTYSHAASYVLGLGIGHFMSVYRSDKYKRVISKKYSLLGCFLALCLMVAVLVIGGQYNTLQPSALESALFVALNRVVWSFGVGIIIVCCEYGHLPLITDFLSWHVFVPLGRLTYGIYLIHNVFILRLNQRIRSPRDCDMLNVAIEAMGVIVASSIGSLVMYLLVEAPSTKLCNLVLQTKKITMLRNKQENDKIIAKDKTG